MEWYTVYYTTVIGSILCVIFGWYQNFKVSIYFHTLFQYRIEFWGNSRNTSVIFSTQKRTLRTMMCYRCKVTSDPVTCWYLNLQIEWIFSMKSSLPTHEEFYNCAIRENTQIRLKKTSKELYLYEKHKTNNNYNSV